jgi:hypothetical protein
MAFAVEDVRARDADFDDRARFRHWRHPNLEVGSWQEGRVEIRPQRHDLHRHRQSQIE